MRKVIILGVTGSIGTQALAVIAANRERYRVTALAAGGQHLELLAQQAAEFQVQYLAIAASAQATEFLRLWKEKYRQYPVPQLLTGKNAATQLAALADENAVVLNGITGSIGLRPTLAALETGATLALANKESLVAGGALVKAAMRRPGQVVPVDSEHSAIAQALCSGRHRKGMTAQEVDGSSEVAKLILTASGGPFRGKQRAELTNVTPAQALAHPTWKMGQVVTINSATLFNKALELIEAAYLFEIAPQDIIPVIHPQSVVHSMVEFKDGATIAQASPPDMKLPIALGLSWPARLENIATPCNWEEAVSWDFAPIDRQTFPAIDLARAALTASPLHPAVMNAANEECVCAFLHGQLKYLEIIDTVAEVLSKFNSESDLTLSAVENCENWARAQAQKIIGAKS